MKYEDWIKYEEARLHNKQHHKFMHISRINGRPLSILTRDDMVDLLRSWIASQRLNHIQYLGGSPTPHNLPGGMRAS